MNDWRYWDKARILSLAIVGVYGAVIFFTGEAGDWIGALVFGFFSLSLIWFGDEIGDYTGFVHMIPVRKSPGGLLRFIGWVLLLLPIVAMTLSRLGLNQV